MPDMNIITHLRHVGFAMPQLEEQRHFYADQWGLTEVAEQNGVYYLAAAGSPEQYVIRLREDERKRADLIAFGASDRAEIDRLHAHLESRGVRMIAAPHELQTPGGGYGIRFFDCDGRAVEVSADIKERTYRDLKEGESIPVQLSHCVINSPTPDETVEWYKDNLGFQVVETGEAYGRTMLWFMRCKHPQHHVLGVAMAPHVAMHHVSFDMRGIDEFLQGVGRMRRGGGKLVWGPGRHKNGENTFAYFLDEAGNIVEYTTGMSHVDEAWEPLHRDITDPAVIDTWGTSNPYSEEIMQQLFNTPDEGLFSAPPA